MTPTTRSSKHVFVTICFLLAALIAFQITREDPEITAPFKHATAHDNVYHPESALNASAKQEAEGQLLRTESNAALPRQDGALRSSAAYDDAPRRNDNILNQLASDEPGQDVTSATTAGLGVETNSMDGDDGHAVNNANEASELAKDDVTIAPTNPEAHVNRTSHLGLHETASKVVQNATKSNIDTSFKLPDKRTAMLDPTKTFSFVHISKAAGATWIRTLLNLKLDVCPKYEAGKEYPVWHQDQVYCKNSDYHLLSLRSPRHHVWSLFTECKYDDWGLRVTNGLGFPRSGNSNDNDETDFNDWLDHFLPMDEHHLDNYKCYHPANFQTRYLESNVSAAHGVKNRPNGPLRFEGNITRAASTYWDQDFVPIVELHHESLCLFYFRLGDNAPKKARMYLNAQCVCPKPSTVGSSGMNENLKMVHVVHHENGHRQELRSLEEGVLQKIRVLTRVDSELYVLALRQMLVEIAWLESRDGMDRRVLCSDVIDRLEPELEYLNVSVLQLYEEAKALVGG